MYNKRILFVSTIFAIITGVILFWLSNSSSAGITNMAERFEKIAASDKLPASETKGTYAIDRAHSYIGFKVRHMGLVDVPGSFNSFEGSIDFDSSKIKNSTVEFSAEVKSIDTRVEGRNNHLRSKDFFEVETYPELTFKSTRVKKKGKRYIVTGNLTMKGVTKEIAIPFRIFGPIKDARGNVKMGIQGETSINRRTFNINYGNNLPNGIPTISDTVVIDLQLETALRKPNETAKQ